MSKLYAQVATVEDDLGCDSWMLESGPENEHKHLCTLKRFGSGQQKCQGDLMKNPLTGSYSLMGLFSLLG